MALATPALEIRNLHKRYGELEVLKGISLTARDGDVISILGSSGSGKSTLLHWRNLPQNLESLNARCGIVSRTGFRLSPAAKAMIETLVAVDQHEVSVAV